MALDQVEVMRHFGFDRFPVIGHDRGERVGHRMALGHPDKVTRLAVLDIIPTYNIYTPVTIEFVQAYFHWFNYLRPAPGPEKELEASTTAQKARLYDVLSTWRGRRVQVTGKGLSGGRNLQEDVPDDVFAAVSTFLKGWMMSTRAFPRFLVFAFALFIVLLGGVASLQVQKGGEDETGPYEAVAGWPQPWAQAGYIWGSQPGVFAESPNRIFLAVRGELKLPATTGRGFNGIWGSLGERATVPKAEMRNCLLVVDGTGKVIERWNQWDALFEGSSGPHKVKISPYDPERHVWVVNDSRQQIYEFTNDGKQLVMTLGEKDVAGDDERHFGQPQDLTWLPDGSILIADGLRNARVVKLDRTGKFVKSWGTRGKEDGQFSGLHGIEADRSGRVYVADRGNQRIQVFDGDGKHLDTWPNIRFPNHILVTADQQQVWVSDGTNARILKYDTNGRLQYWWGVYGTQPGTFWEMHQFSVDSEGNLYAADSFGGRTQKFRPRQNGDRSKLVGLPMPLAGK